MSKGRKILLGFVWLLVAIILWATLRDTEWSQVLDAFQRLQPGQIGILIFLNAGLIVLFGTRWWLILGKLGWPVPLANVALYRLGAFSISYFTPGPQFGGEPLQVHLLRKHHQLPGPTAGASVGLDKLFELLANFGFLMLGIIVVLTSDILPGNPGWGGPMIGALLLLVPVAYLFALSRGRLPLSAAIREVIETGLLGEAWTQRLAGVLETESQMGQFCMQSNTALLQVLGLSMLFWIGLVVEYSLALNFLGDSFSLLEVIAVITAARVAFLLPLPGGLGALELSQILMLQALGAPAELGVTISLFIRGRDILFGLVGLAVAGIYLRRAGQEEIHSPEDPVGDSDHG
jgi:uncharacterized protein (TIRG00374 family)